MKPAGIRRGEHASSAQPPGCRALFLTLALPAAFNLALAADSGPAHFPWETSDIGTIWSDNFNRASLGTNWIILGGANAMIVSNQLQFSQTNLDTTRQVYYQPWLFCSDSWTLRWTERFGALDANSTGVGMGIKNFQAAGGDDRGWNALLSGAGTNRGRLLIQRFNGTSHLLTATGPALTLAAGDVVDCSLTRTGWTMTATASNRANAQVATVSTNFSHVLGILAPSISRTCCYPLGGTVFIDDVSYTINHRKPARFLFIGASTFEGADATSAARRYINVVQSNYNEVVCNDSSALNTTGDAVSSLPEILVHQPDTAILDLGGNDVLYGYSASVWQNNYSNLVNQLSANGVRVRPCLPPPRTHTDLTALKNWIASNYPPADVIDLWTPFLQGTSALASAYDDGDGTHLNDAGQQLLGQIIVSNLPPGIRAQPQSQTALAGGTASFTTVATGRAPLTYQWFLNGTNALNDGARITGSTTPTLTISNTLAGDAGLYVVVVTNPAGSTTSTPPAVLTVLDPHPTIGSVLLSKETISITWSSIAGQTYRLQFKQTLNDAVWQDIPPTTTAAGPTVSATNTIAGSPQGFYRVRLGP
jgi:lysophospholipase L1-like esterase